MRADENVGKYQSCMISKITCSSKKSPVAALPQYNDTHDDGVLSASAILATVQW